LADKVRVPFTTRFLQMFEEELAIIECPAAIVTSSKLDGIPAGIQDALLFQLEGPTPAEVNEIPIKFVVNPRIDRQEIKNILVRVFMEFMF
jgi:hypothetical protein